MRLIPRNFHRRDRADVQAFDVRERHDLLNELRVVRYDRRGQRVADLFQHFTLRDLNHTGVGTKEFAVSQRMRKGIAKRDGRPDEDAAVEGSLARTTAILRRRVHRAGSFQAFFDLPVNEIRHFRVGETGEFRVRIVGARRLNRSESLRNRVGNFSGILRHHDRRGVDTRATAIVRNARYHHVQIVAPLLNAVFADQDFAPAWPVETYTPVVFGLWPRVQITWHGWAN